MSKNDLIPEEATDRISHWVTYWPDGSTGPLFCDVEEVEKFVAAETPESGLLGNARVGYVWKTYAAWRAYQDLGIWERLSGKLTAEEWRVIKDRLAAGEEEMP